MPATNLKFVPATVAMPEVVVNDLEAGLGALTDWLEAFLKTDLHPMLEMRGKAARAEALRLQRVLAENLK